MRKVLLSLVILLGLFTGCSEDEIIIGATVNGYKLPNYIDNEEIFDNEIVIIFESGEDIFTWEGDKYEKIINVSKAKSRIHVFNRFIPDEQLGDFFVAADLLALPYLSASQSGVTATAIQFDLPIISSNVGDLSNSITNETGALVVPGDSNALGEAIEAWFSKEHTGLGEAYAKIKASKSWEEFARQLF